jgi:hypothetical protein
MKRKQVRETFEGWFDMGSILQLAKASDDSAFTEKFKEYWPEEKIHVTIEKLPKGASK